MNLILSFDTDDPEFRRGVEVGMLYQRLRVEPLPIEGMVRIENAEMMLRLGEAIGCNVQTFSVYHDDFGTPSDEWVEVVFGRRGDAL